ncbi:hypothetical protein ACGFZQ_29735 [Streptomyces sp. NPDC048254]|uniref:hypothetical protein n=1 Tax=Streptomyces sp. NPDC048254 TaxID=3365525 RepID=UPI003714391B
MSDPVAAARADRVRWHVGDGRGDLPCAHGAGPAGAGSFSWAAESLDVLPTYENGQQQILEVDEKQHFTAARALTLECYPAGVKLGFDASRWLARSQALTGREPGGGFGKPKPPLFPGEGGRHRQRAFRDAPTDLLPPVHDWLPALRISDTEVTAITAAPDPVSSLRAPALSLPRSVESVIAGEVGVHGVQATDVPA